MSERTIEVSCPDVLIIPEYGEPTRDCYSATDLRAPARPLVAGNNRSRQRRYSLLNALSDDVFQLAAGSPNAFRGSYWECRPGYRPGGGPLGLSDPCRATYRAIVADETLTERPLDEPPRVELPSYRGVNSRPSHSL